MRDISLKNITFMVTMFLLLWFSSIETCNARRGGRHWRRSHGGVATNSLYKKKAKTQHHNSKSKPKSPSPVPPSPASHSPPVTGDEITPNCTYSVFDFGAVGDGKTDDTKVHSYMHNQHFSCIYV